MNRLHADPASMSDTELLSYYDGLKMTNSHLAGLVSKNNVSQSGINWSQALEERRLRLEIIKEEILRRMAYASLDVGEDARGI